MRPDVCILLLSIATISTTVRSLNARGTPQPESCRPAHKVSRTRDITTCLEQTAPVTMVTQLVGQTLRWNHVVLISDRHTDSESISNALEDTHVSVTAVEARTALSDVWMRSMAATGPSSAKQRVNLVVVCSYTCMLSLLQQEGNLSLNRKFNEGLTRFMLTDQSVISDDAETHYRKVVRGNYVYLGVLYNQLLWQQRDCRLAMGKETMKSTMHSSVFAKDSALIAYFSEVIYEVHANGLVETWNKRWQPQSKYGPSQKQPSVISLGHMKGTLYVSVSGATLSFIVLFLERCVVCFERRKRRLFRMRHWID